MSLQSIKTSFVLVSTTIFSLFVVTATAFAIPPVIGDGCLPGDPCYVEPVKAVPTPTPAPVVIEEVEPVAPIVIEEDEPCLPFYATVGAGYIFPEKDEEVLSHLATEVRFGIYRFLDNVSFEFGVGYQPDVRNREHPDPGRFALSGDTASLSYFGDFLFHLTDETEGFDPYVSLGGGVIDYEDTLANGSTQWFVAGGAGAFVPLTETLFIKPDYRVRMVDENTEVNQLGIVALGTRF